MTRRLCAIYTRKLTEEGLKQDFNSLDAQRDACEAYIRSQAGEGWRASKARYDDGGFSGATLERPGLQALLDDIELGRVNIIVVYKVDRLTRSLADFAKLVERFDAQGVSFVSVTQQFNTTTSMGRLTLNVLLSFAQFEREVTAERIRDKIAQSKKKGLWMGGVVPLGYDVEDRKLVVNQGEAETVQRLFRLYLELGTVNLAKEEADRLGLKTKARKPNNGRSKGALPFTRGHLYKLLANPVYIGGITHKGERHKGEHEAIVDYEVWERVQGQLQSNAVSRRSISNSKSRSLLTGLLFDAEGHRMVPSHTSKSGRRYRYYVSRPPEEKAADASRGWRLPALMIESLVVRETCRLLKDSPTLIDALNLARLPANRMREILSLIEKLEDHLHDDGPEVQQRLLQDLNDRIEVRPGSVCISYRTGKLISLVDFRAEECDPSTDAHFQLDVPVQFRWRGVEMKLVLGSDPQPRSKPDHVLIRLIAQAYGWMEELKQGSARSNRELAIRHKADPGDVARILPLAFLAPDIGEAILEGRQPVEITAAKLKRLPYLPVSWKEQRRLLGFC